jgi:Ca2+-binding RTX toxin-like protein
MRPLRPVIASLMIPSALLVATPAATATAHTCQGLEATIVGTNGPDQLTGTELDDVVWLGKGKDSFDGAGGNDVICGGGGKDSLVGGVGDDKIFGEAGNDQIAGSAGNDLLNGGAGKDTMAGGTDNDRVRGGAGNDFFHEDLGDDKIYGGAGRDWLSYFAYYTEPVGVTVDAAAHTVDGAGHDVASSVETYEGTNVADTMIGGPGADDLRARGGDNEVTGGGGNDYLEAFGGEIRAGDGDDYANAGADVTVYLGAGNDQATFAFGSPRIYGEGGNDVFGVEKKQLHAWADGGPGENRISFKGAKRSVTANIGAGTASWQNGQMTFQGVQNIAGTQKNDRLTGSPLSDFIVGGEGNDVIKGLAGNDLLKGGPGRDTIDGGADYDICAGERYRGCEYEA